MDRFRDAVRRVMTARKLVQFADDLEAAHRPESRLYAGVQLSMYYRGDADAAAALMAAHLDEVVGRARLGDGAGRTRGIGAILERYAG